MAKIWFAMPDGERKSFKLDRNRILRIGRDPGNDIVLRDARVSRQHAQILFERGFFVLQDLSSSNGSYVQGKKIRVAPLTDGADLRLGNTVGQFTEELPSPSTDVPSPNETVARAMPVQVEELQEVAEMDVMMTRPHEAASPDDFPPDDASRETRPHTQSDGAPEEEDAEGESEKDLPESSEGTADPVVAPVDEVVKLSIEDALSTDATLFHGEDHEEPGPQTATQPSTRLRFTLTRYLIDLGPPESDRGTIRDEAERPLFYFRRNADLVGCTAAVVTSITILSGIAATLILLIEGRLIAAAIAVLLTVAFSWLIALLVPRRNLSIHDSEQLQSPVLSIHQDSRYAVPKLRFSVRNGAGEVIAFLQRGMGSRLGAHSWKILNRESKQVAVAREASFLRAIFHNFAGSFFGVLRTDFVILVGGYEIGRLVRSADRRKMTVDLSADVRAGVDRRVALALAVVIDAVEK